ncbi:MAG: 50S ribosomal protein L30 [Gemmatimonadales bacterium]|nr:50S ribosomal protein L30 [Gemmatimonadales bacterium]
MGRNPAVGRQGPAYHAATVPDESVAPRVRVKQVRSASGHAHPLRRVLEALGLKHYQDVVELPNNAGVRGMLFKVRHLVEVAPAEAK